MFDPQTSHDRRIQVLMKGTLWVLMSFGTVYGGYAITLQSRDSVFLACSSLLYGCVLYFASRLWDNGKVRLACGYIFGSMNAIAISTAVLLPSMTPALLIVPVLALAMILAYFDGKVLAVAAYCAWTSSTVMLLVNNPILFREANHLIVWLLTSTASATVAITCAALVLTKRHMYDMITYIASQQMQVSMLFRSMDEALFVLDASRRIVLLNPAAQSLCVPSIKSFVGLPLHEVMLPAADQIERMCVGTLPLDTNPVSYTNVHGDTRYLSVTSSVYPFAQAAPGRLLVCRDVTEQYMWNMRLQETQRLESMGVMAGGVAHDFNNILAIILGNSALAQIDIDATSITGESMQNIDRAARRASDLVKQMLFYAGHGSVLYQRVDIHRLIDDTLRFAGVSIPSQIEVTNTCGLEPSWCTCDGTQIQQVLLNLLLNASEAMSPHGGTIRISTSAQSVLPGQVFAYLRTAALAAGEYVAIEVADSAAGMSPQVMRRLFEPFFSTKFAGRGLGMAAVAGIVRSHGGGIAIWSQVGVGTTFTIYIPLGSTHLRPSFLASSPAFPSVEYATVDHDQVLTIGGDQDRYK